MVITVTRIKIAPLKRTNLDKEDIYNGLSRTKILMENHTIILFLGCITNKHTYSFCVIKIKCTDSISVALEKI